MDKFERMKWLVGEINKHNKNYYTNLFGTKGAQLSIAKAVLFEIIQTVVSVVLSIVFILTILL